MINVPFIGVLTYCASQRVLPTEAATANPTVLGETKLSYYNKFQNHNHHCGVWYGKAKLYMIDIKTIFTNMEPSKAKPSTLHFKIKKLSTNSPRDFNSVLDTMNHY